MPVHPRLAVLLLGGALVMTACSDPIPEGKTVAARPADASASTPDVAPTPLAGASTVTLALASNTPRGEAINAAIFDPAAADPETIKPALIRAQVLLDRARRSPGVIDGRTGTNLSLAIESFQSARGLPVNGKLDKVVWDALVAGDGGPVMTDCAVTTADVAGPFQPGVSNDDFEAMAKLPALS